MQIYGVELIEPGDMVIHHQSRTETPFEYESVMAWMAACKGGVAIDVGAYTGLYAIIAARLGAKVLALEPNPAAIARLRENVAANGVAVECHPAAASDRTGAARFVGRPGLGLTSAGRIVPGTGVPTLRLDDLELDDVRAIKVDTEGHECQVIEGAAETIARFRPLIITEALNAAARDAQQRLLAPMGYQPTEADEWNLIWKA
ncbi:FkbM family methyltransferase [Halomonas getboli]|uniref:FkbM family methyltransferase n=1 Tax=Halomonas getboli TaxID=2935862 RepID=UPI001FFFE1AB|nr:FkbM family methyltransferase [Halomonas getboli]MCK2183511.1 FkbM family methyltransferase [Halomonas getboli]